MKKSSQKESSSLEESAEKKKTVKYALIFSAVVGIVFSAVWFGGEFLASESLISTASVKIEGKERNLRFSEKVSGRSRNYQSNSGESGIRHYAYYLELVDPVNHSSLAKVRFKAPVLNIQQTPSMITLGETVWIVSTTNSSDRDRQGFVLKFVLNGVSIQQMDFDLDEKYRIRKIEGDKVFVTEGSDPYVSRQAHYYLDLNTGKIVDGRMRITN